MRCSVQGALPRPAGLLGLGAGCRPQPERLLAVAGVGPWGVESGEDAEFILLSPLLLPEPSATVRPCPSLTPASLPGESELFVNNK